MIKEVCVITSHDAVYEHMPTRSNARALLRRAFATSNSVFVEHVKSAGFSFTISCDWPICDVFARFLQLQFVPLCGKLFWA